MHQKQVAAAPAGACGKPALVSFSLALYVMSTLDSLFLSMKDVPELHNISLGTLNNFVRLVVSLKKAILHRQPRHWNAAIAPTNIPAHILSFLASRLSLSDQHVLDIWHVFKNDIWNHEAAVLDHGLVPPSVLDQLCSTARVCM